MPRAISYTGSTFRLIPDIRRLDIGLLARCLVPGWGHLSLGRSARGKWFFGVWLALVAGVVSTFGSLFGAVLIGLAITAHAASLVDLLWTTLQPPRAFNVLTVAAQAAIGSLACVSILYLPLWWCVTSLLESRQFLLDSPPFRAGDVVLPRPISRVSDSPLPGQVVLYRLPNARMTQQYGRIQIQRDGEAVNRIIAGSGSVVRWQEGVLTVDGVESNLRPLNVERMPSVFEATVPDRHVCIFPTTSALLFEAGDYGDWRQQSIIPEDAVLRRAVLRNYPIWRLWWIR